MAADDRFGGQSMTGILRRVAVCPPEAAGWPDPGRSARWRELGYEHSPDLPIAAAQHDELRRRLEAAGCDVIDFPPAGGLSLDAVYAHDASLMTDEGAILMRMGKPARRGEPQIQAAHYRSLGIPILGAIREPGTAEAGDLVWLDRSTLLAGRGFRTNAEGIEQLGALLRPHGVEVIEAPLPHGRGPDACLHLMSLMSMLDERVALVDLPWLAAQTVELLRERGFTLVEIDAAERDSLACNVLSLGDGRLLALRENPSTNRRLEEHRFRVATFPGSEIGRNGAGGPTCLTRPLLRT